MRLPLHRFARRFRNHVLPVFLVLAVVTHAHTDSHAGKVQDKDGVPHVQNGLAPDKGKRTIQLAEAWRFSIEEEEELIGVLSTALAGPDGTVWLADRQLGQVMVYSADGQHMRTVSGSGEGPGEVNSPTGLLWFPDGSLGIQDNKQGQITRIDVQGIPLSSMHMRDTGDEPMASARLSMVRGGGGVLAVCGTQFNFSTEAMTQNRFFSIFDTDGNELSRLLEAPSGFDFNARTYDEKANYFVDRGSWSIDDQGMIYCAPYYDQYRIEVRDSGGSLVRVIERQYKPRQRTEEDKQTARDGSSMSINGERVPLDCDLQDYDSFVNTIESVAGGQLWVQNGTDHKNLPDGIARSYDVFDAAGHFVEVVEIACEMDPDQDQLLRLADGRWILFRNIYDAFRALYAGYRDDDEEVEEDSEPMEIVCFEAGK